MYINQDKLNRLIDLYAGIRAVGEFGLRRTKKSLRSRLLAKRSDGLHVDNSWEVVEVFCRRYVNETGIVMKGFSRPYIYRQEVPLYASSLRHNLLMSKTKTSRNGLDLALFAASFALILSFLWIRTPWQIAPLAAVLFLAGCSVQAKQRRSWAWKIQTEVVNLLEYVDRMLNRGEGAL